jgi:hypothetical protein
MCPGHYVLRGITANGKLLLRTALTSRSANRSGLNGLASERQQSTDDWSGGEHAFVFTQCGISRHECIRLTPGHTLVCC